MNKHLINLINTLLLVICSFGISQKAQADVIKGDFASSKYCSTENKVEETFNGITYSLCHNGDNLGLLEIYELVDFVNYTEPIGFGLNENSIKNIFVNSNYIDFNFLDSGKKQVFDAKSLGITKFSVGYELNDGLKFGDFNDNENGRINLSYGFNQQSGDILNEISVYPKKDFNVTNATPKPTPSVPEPSTLLLFSLAIGLIARNNYKQKSSLAA